MISRPKDDPGDTHSTHACTGYRRKVSSTCEGTRPQKAHTDGPAPTPPCPKHRLSSRCMHRHGMGTASRNRCGMVVFVCTDAPHMDEGLVSGRHHLPVTSKWPRTRTRRSPGRVACAAGCSAERRRVARPSTSPTTQKQTDCMSSRTQQTLQTVLSPQLYAGATQRRVRPSAFRTSASLNRVSMHGNGRQRSTAKDEQRPATVGIVFNLRECQSPGRWHKRWPRQQFMYVI